jgi:hypothetical protein
MGPGIVFELMCSVLVAFCLVGWRNPQAFGS